MEAGRAIMDSVLGKKGLTFSVEMARQSGKNELSAQIEVLLLTLFMARGGNSVKCSPTFRPQTLVSLLRLKERLNDAGYAGLWRPEHGYMIRLGRARQLFFSADGSSQVVGATAHLLLEVDEAQDVASDKYARDFRPMGAATNVTTVLFGTAWDSSSLLEQTKQLNLELERRDGIRRHFRFDWQEVSKYNPDYLGFVEAELSRLGESHPLFQTQYCLNPLHGGGGFLSPQQQAQLQGHHARRHEPQEGCVYIAGIDLAGEAEATVADGSVQDAAWRAIKPRQDSTVVTVAELDFSVADEVNPEPGIKVVEHCWWTGRPHTSLYPQLVDVLRRLWGCKRVVVDSTGVGAGVASFLKKALGSGVAEPFQFTQASKSRLGFQLLAAVNSGRVKMYAPDGSEECRELWLEMERARSHFRPNQTINFYVEPAQGHDDFLMSLALALEASRYRPRQARGRPGVSHGAS